MDEAITEKQTLRPIAPKKYQQKQSKQTGEIERLNKVIKEQSLRIKGLEKILDIQQTSFKPTVYNKLSLDDLYKRKYASKYYLPIRTPEGGKYKQELKSCRGKRKEEERISRHKKQETAIVRKAAVKTKELRAIRKHQEKITKHQKQEKAIARKKRAENKGVTC